MHVALPTLALLLLGALAPSASAQDTVTIYRCTDSAGNLTVDPASATVTMGQPSTFTAAWSGLDATQKYLGQVNYLQDGTIAGSTLVTVNP